MRFSSKAVGWAFVATAAGLSISFLVHISTFIGVNPQRFPAVWLLHIGVFAVWLPTVFVLREIGNRVGGQPKQALALMFSWRTAACALLMLYAMFNFFYSGWLNDWLSPDIVNGSYVLSNHGTVVRTITVEEFEQRQAFVVRLFSGGWLAFYGAATLALRTRLELDMNEGTGGFQERLP